jgi:hypothetical protein
VLFVRWVEVNSLIIPCSDLAEHDAYFSAENLEEREQAAHWFPCIFRCSQGSGALNPHPRWKAVPSPTSKTLSSLKTPVSGALCISTLFEFRGIYA